MSFDPNHININRSNYEEYLLLYVDNELSAAEKTAVEAFLQLHPDLQAELELLQSTILPAEDLSFNKSELFADQMSLNSIDEKLLLYIDDELTLDEKSLVAQQIEENKTTALQFALLQQTKLDPSDIVTYPNKAELYHRSERRGFAWLQVAAALLIVLMGAWFWLQNDTAHPAQPGLVSATLPQESTPNATKQTNKTTTSVAEQSKTAPVEVIALSHVSSRASTQGGEHKNKGVVSTDPQTPVSIAAVNTGTPADQPQEITTTLQRTNTIATDNNVSIASLNNTPEQILNTSLVTSAPVARTTIKQAVTADNNTSSKTPLKGLLRKATRFIEHTTGISATNENNEVLIASLAVRLD